MNKLSITLSKGKKVYFASDFHLGAPDLKSSKNREYKIRVLGRNEIQLALRPQK